jgi:hypothetical protein
MAKVDGAMIRFGAAHREKMRFFNILFPRRVNPPIRIPAMAWGGQRM